MRKPKFNKTAQRRLKKKQRHEQKRKEARKAQRAATVELQRVMNGMSEEELQKFLGPDAENDEDSTEN